MIAFYFFRVIETLLMLLPHYLRSAFFKGLAWLAYKLSRKHRRIIRQNILFIFPDATEAFIEETSRYCFKNLLLNFLQMMENSHLSIEELSKRMRFNSDEIVKLAQEKGRPIVFSTGHFGRWELAGIAISSLVKPTMVVYKEMKNLHFQHYLDESRERFGIRSVEKHGAVRQLMKQLKRGESISLLVDTNLNKRDGILVDFFGHPTRTTTTTADLARKYNALIIPGFIVTDDEENFELKFAEPIEVAQTDDIEADIKEATQKQVTALENIMKEYPQLWFWCHKRFKTDYPELYK